MDASAMIPRSVVESTVFLHAEIPEEHPSVAALGEERLGAGVAVAGDRILTAHYLVLGAQRVRVTSPDGRLRSVERIELDHETGLALLAVDGPGLRPVRLGRSRDVRPGLPVFLLTYSGAEERTGATGHVSAVEPFEAFWEYMLDGAILTTVVNPGVAGAPLFDLEARLLGVVSLGLANVGRYSLAIPIDLYSERRDDLEAGDVILSVDGEAVSGLRQLYRRIWRKNPGDPVGLQVLRGASIHVVEVASRDRYEFYR